MEIKFKYIYSVQNSSSLVRRSSFSMYIQQQYNIKESLFQFHLVNRFFQYPGSLFRTVKLGAGAASQNRSSGDYRSCYFQHLHQLGTTIFGNPGSTLSSVQLVTRYCSLNDAYGGYESLYLARIQYIDHDFSFLAADMQLTCRRSLTTPRKLS